jgi:hypothetical protein
MNAESADLRDVLKRLAEKHRKANQKPVEEEKVPQVGEGWPVDHIPHNNC